jgi:hypothetical protein
MNDQTIKLVFGVAAAVGVAIGGYYATRKYLPIVRNRIKNWLETDRHNIREQVIAWLHKNNLDKTALLDLVNICDTVANLSNKIMFKVCAKTEKTGLVDVYEEIITLEELEKVDPDVAKQVLNKITQERTSIMGEMFL